MCPAKNGTRASSATGLDSHNSNMQISQTILVVEDDEDNRLMLKVLLQALGYHVIEATDGREAVETAQRELPGLILMDLSLPRVDGLTATLRIRELAETRSLPIVIISGYTAADFRAVAFDAGCSEYLAKPLDFDHLEKTIEHLLPRP